MLDDASEPGRFEGEVTILETRNTGTLTPAAGLLTARFAGYPGCQQLTLRLPSSGYKGYTELSVRHADGRILLRDAVRNLLSGDVQVLLDTLAWPPGEMTLQIRHAAGGSHELALRKAAGPAPPLPASRALADPGDDLLRRGTESPARRVDTRAMGRGGALVYHDGTEGARTISFDYEFGSGVVLIFTPVASRWEADTGYPKARRDEIVRFVAEAARREHAAGWRCELHPDHIALINPRARR
jgi:hypothetical protein